MITAACTASVPPTSEPTAVTSPAATQRASARPVSSPVSGSPELPVIAPDEPRILYAHLTDAGGGVFVMRPDGSDIVQLATDIAIDAKHPDWSPDGMHVVFVDGPTEQIWVAHLDGSPTEQVTTCDRNGCDYPAWSPDGASMAFSRYETDPEVAGPTALSILVADLATDSERVVARLERPLLVDVPRWSPDGTSLVVGVDRMDDEGNEMGASIAVVPVGGGDLRYLTEFEQFGYFPDWNSATDQIVFSTEVMAYKADQEPGDDTWNLWTVESDGTGIQQLTDVEPGQRLWRPSWTPDGSAVTAGYEDTRRGVFVDPATGTVDLMPTTELMSGPRLRP